MYVCIYIYIYVYTLVEGIIILSRNVQRIEGGLDQGDELSRYSHVRLSIRPTDGHGYIDSDHRPDQEYIYFRGSV